jgi:hypothetical protein
LCQLRFFLSFSSKIFFLWCCLRDAGPARALRAFANLVRFCHRHLWFLRFRLLLSVFGFLKLLRALKQWQRRYLRHFNPEAPLTLQHLSPDIADPFCLAGNVTWGRSASRVARWFVFKPKILIWENFAGSCNGRCWYILWTLGPFYTAFCYILLTFGIVRGKLVYFTPFWYFVPRKIWQPCSLVVEPFYALFTNTIRHVVRHDTQKIGSILSWNTA